MGNIRKNLEEIRIRIEEKAKASGRDPKDILLCAVTKTRSPEEINEGISCGVTDIGENRVQELLEKHEIVTKINWHMIGHLQTNKVKYIIDKVCMIHSVDSFKLAEEIDKRAGQLGIKMDILLQVNPAEEESKFGVSIAETDSLFQEILKNCSNLRIRGLMTIAPYTENPEEIRPYFKQMKQLFDTYSKKKDAIADFNILSMGMTHDYEIAIEEGSTLVRIGTGIFGDR